MTTSEKVAYLKGLAEGMGINEDAGQGKLFKVIIDILEALSLDLADTRDSMTDLSDALEAVSDDLCELEEEFYEDPWDDDEDDDEDEDEDEDDEYEDDTVFYSVECPGCGFKLTAPYSEERKQAIREAGKAKGIHTRLKKEGSGVRE